MTETSQELQRSGMLLLNGPDAIYARPRDSSRYVESVLSVKWRSAQCEQWRSVIIYCDGNGDEVAGFLKPLARFASWDRKTALKLISGFPLRRAWPIRSAKNETHTIHSFRSGSDGICGHPRRA